MSARLAKYVRRHHVALIALMLVIAGGSAYAAGLAKNSVKSKQIKNGQVKSIDVADEALTAVDIRDGAVNAAEVADGALGGAEIGDGSLTGADLADGSIGAADLAQGAAADVRSNQTSFANDNILREILEIPGIGRVEARCTVGGWALQFRNESSGDQATAMDLGPRGGPLATSNTNDATPPNGTALSVQGTGSMQGVVRVAGSSGQATIDVLGAGGVGTCTVWTQALVDRG